MKKNNLSAYSKKIDERNNNDQDILKKNPVFLVFENELQAQLFNARCHDTGQKIDTEKAKMFKQQISKINSKKYPNILNLYSMRLGVNSIMKLASLIKNKQYQTINLSDNAISQYGIHAIKNLINTTKILHLNLSSNMISEVGLSVILDDLIKNTYLKSLDLGILEGSIRKNSLGIDGARCLAAVLMQNKYIDTLKLEDNDIGIAGAEILAIALKQTKVLKNFKLSENLIKTQGAEAILKNGIHLVSLDIGKNFIKSSIGGFLKSYLQINYSLKKLNLEFNELLSEGTKILCKGLQKSKLTHLNIKGNSIRDQGLEYLCEIFQSKECECTNTLEELDISINEITHEGVVFLKRLLTKSKIRSLNISKNIIADEGLMELADQIEDSQQNIVLNKIDFSSCKISDRGIIKFIEILQNLSDLQHIKATDNYISDKNEKTILELLSKNTNLIAFALNGNRLSLTCLKSIKKIMDKNMRQLEQREPNKIKSEIYRLKEKQKKIAETKERLELQNREIGILEQTKSKLLETLAKLERDENQKKIDYESAIQRKREQIERKNEALKTKVQELENEKRNKQKILEKLGVDLKQITQKRSELEYQIKITKQEGNLLEREFATKSEALKGAR